MADAACRLSYANYLSDSSAANWAIYQQGKQARMQTVMEQHRQLFAQRVSTLDPARANDWNLVKSRDRFPDFRGSVIDGVSSLTAKVNLLASRFSPPTPTPTLRVPRHTSTPRVSLPELEAALHKTQRGKAPGPDGVHPEFLRDGLSHSGNTAYWWAPTTYPHQHKYPPTCLPWP